MTIICYNIDEIQYYELCSMQLDEALIRRLQDNDPTLTMLDFDGYIGSMVRELIDALKVNRVVKELYLTRNGIGDELMIELSDILKVNSVITHLYIGYNDIRNEGAIGLAEALKMNKAITHFFLCENKIGNEGAAALAKAFQASSTIVDISLSGNNMDDEVGRPLIEAVEGNSIITRCQLINRYVTSAQLEALDRAIKSNQELLLRSIIALKHGGTLINRNG